MNFVDRVKKYFNDRRINKETKVLLNDPFPCNDCVVGASCTKPCDKLERDSKMIMKMFEKHQCCIDCGEKKLLEGPSGGMSQNVKCSNCNHEYNFMYPMGIDRIGTFV